VKTGEREKRERGGNRELKKERINERRPPKKGLKNSLQSPGRWGRVYDKQGKRGKLWERNYQWCAQGRESGRGEKKNFDRRKNQSKGSSLTEEQAAKGKSRIKTKGGGREPKENVQGGGAADTRGFMKVEGGKRTEI